jgi:dUTP pyrophosphatase
MCNSIGLIDKGYTGTLKCPFYNVSDESFVLQRGERYVQLVNSDLSNICFKLVDELRDTKRGDGGFGSTGK